VSSTSASWGGVLASYWLTGRVSVLHVLHTVPLFIPRYDTVDTHVIFVHLYSVVIPNEV
jgi:hypothetical protein